MKKRIVMLFVSLFALTPVVMGASFAGEITSKEGRKLECALHHSEAKKTETENATSVQDGSATSLAKTGSDVR